MDRPHLPINISLLRWAREEAGLTLEEAAQKAKITSPRQRKDALPISPAERLESWEAGQDGPSLPQLEALASAYRRPLITFFLPAPPTTQASLADFRTFAGASRGKDSPEFAAFKRRLEALHKELVAIIESEPHEVCAYVGSASADADPIRLAQQIRRTLNFTFEDQQKSRDGDQVLQILRDRAQAINIFVLFEGDLGSYHSKINAEEFRGIAFAHKVAPLIVVNPNDAPAARIFTFAHELAHIWIGSTGVSNVSVFESREYNVTRDIERVCNAVAAEFLLPMKLVRSEWHAVEDEELDGLVGDMARRFKVSREVVARRLYDAKLINTTMYRQLLTMYAAFWKKRKEKPQGEGGGPSRNVLDRFRLGERTLGTVIGAAYDGRITLQSASRLLGVPVSRFDKVMYAVRD